MIESTGGSENFGYLFGGPQSKANGIWVYTLGSPYFGKLTSVKCQAKEVDGIRSIPHPPHLAPTSLRNLPLQQALL